MASTSSRQHLTARPRRGLSSSPSEAMMSSKRSLGQYIVTLGLLPFLVMLAPPPPILPSPKRAKCHLNCQRWAVPPSICLPWNDMSMANHSSVCHIFLIPERSGTVLTASSTKRLNSSPAALERVTVFPIFSSSMRVSTPPCAINTSKSPSARLNNMRSSLMDLPIRYRRSAEVALSSQLDWPTDLPRRPE